MPERRVRVAAEVGLHARPAAAFVRAAAEQPVQITIAKNGSGPVAANSLLAVLGLGVQHGEEVLLAADEGEGAELSLDTLARLLETAQ